MADVVGDDVDLPYCEEEEDEIFAIWRILAAMIAISLVAAFFYFLEYNKRRAKPSESKKSEETESTGSHRLRSDSDEFGSVAVTNVTAADFDLRKRQTSPPDPHANFTQTQVESEAKQTSNEEESEVEEIVEKRVKLQLRQIDNNLPTDEDKVKFTTSATSDDNTDSRQHPVVAKVFEEKFGPDASDAIDTMAEEIDEIEANPSGIGEENEDQNTEPPGGDEEFEEEGDIVDHLVNGEEIVDHLHADDHLVNEESVDHLAKLEETVDHTGAEGIVDHMVDDENVVETVEVDNVDHLNEEGNVVNLMVDKENVDVDDNLDADDVDHIVVEEVISLKRNTEDFNANANEPEEEIEVNVSYNFDRAEITQDAIVQVATVTHIEEESESEKNQPKVNGNQIETDSGSSEAHSHHVSVMDVLGASSADKIAEKLESLEEVTEIMRLAGLESSNLIFGIDYTASNKYQGEHSFGGRSLHAIVPGIENPYQQVIKIFGKTLAPFATSGYIPAYGFGDVKTFDVSVFPLNPDGHCKSFDELLAVYTRITPKVILSGPTNFAPLIEEATEICKKHRYYHILVIIADGQVTNERATRRAIVEACKYPLSIIVVGVGDGPWDMMGIFDNSLPKRPWDNFHFVEFNAVIDATVAKPDVNFAVQSLLEIPDQYKKVKSLGLLNFDSDE